MAQDKGNSDLTEIIFISGFVIAFGCMYYFSSHFYVIADIWRHVRMAELSLLRWIPTSIQEFLGLEVDRAIAFLSRPSTKHVEPSTIQMFDSYWARRLSILPGLFLIWCGYRFIKHGGGVTQQYTRETLLQRQAPFYDHIMPYLTTNPESMELRFRRGDKSSYAHSMSLSPHEFATMSPPLGLESEAKANAMFARPIYIEEEGDFDDDLAERAFIKQLGRPYSGLASLSEIEQTLYRRMVANIPWSRDAMLDLTLKMLKCVSKGDERYDSPIKAEEKMYAVVKAWVGTELLRLNGESWWKKNMHVVLDAIGLSQSKRKEHKPADLCSDLDARRFVDSGLFKSTFKDVEAERTMARHAFIRTGLMSVLVRLRDAGNYPPNQYKDLLKGSDRTLWYCICSVGKFVSFAESAGAFCHWQIESVVGRPLPKPDVSVTVGELRNSLKLPKR